MLSKAFENKTEIEKIEIEKYIYEKYKIRKYNLETFLLLISNSFEDGKYWPEVRPGVSGVFQW